MSSPDLESIIGKFRGVYIANSADIDLQRSSSSGGIATTISSYMLEKGLAEKVSVVVAKKNNPSSFEQVVKKTIKGVRLASQSKYTYVPINKNIIKEVKQSKGLVYVGRPCQVSSISKIAKKDRDFRKKLVLTVGLFCNHSVTEEATDFICYKKGISRSDITNLKFREGSYPGGMVITLKNGSCVKVDTRETWGSFWGAYCFTPRSCMGCDKSLSFEADISIGDAWLEGIHNKKALVIVRTKKGEEIFREISKDRIIAKKIEPEKVLEAATMIFSKRLMSQYMLKKSFNLSPDNFLARWAVANNFLLSKRGLWRFHKILELPLRLFVALYAYRYRRVAKLKKIGK